MGEQTKQTHKLVEGNKADTNVVSDCFKKVKRDNSDKRKGNNTPIKKGGRAGIDLTHKRPRKYRGWGKVNEPNTNT